MSAMIPPTGRMMRYEFSDACIASPSPMVIIELMVTDTACTFPVNRARSVG